MTKQDKIYTRLLDNIWITRKCRIQTSERLESTDFWAQVLINYYTLIVLVASIWTISPENSTPFISFVLVIASLFLFASTLFVSSRDFKSRAKDLKNCYLKMEGLYRELQIIQEDPNTKEINLAQFKDISNKYDDLLSNVENHSKYDYLIFIKEQKIRELSLSENQRIFWYRVRIRIVIIGLFILPLLIPSILIFLKGESV
ncbi:SLATT domain-containing protein [Brevibacillus sp. HB1.4B]|uniref:SLATT domain-containing protein n=1 Tax=Brevibacillus sp. HB1.4B TaxID=2738845 RepID=UPI00156A746A|nr:SLATT domain-containing protein [Brevibacillus sp. HB1.4B]NRS15860.1 SLATT domain-containing protein [Brevibacillus sp. HB1.4B]